jgi:hypothetical protein
LENIGNNKTKWAAFPHLLVPFSIFPIPIQLLSNPKRKKMKTISKPKKPISNQPFYNLTHTPLAHVKGQN